MILISKLLFHVWLAFIWTSSKNEWNAKCIAGVRAFALISPTLPNFWLLLAYLLCFTFGLIINNGNRTEWSPIRSVIIRVINKIGRPRSGSPICLITSMITDRIGWHEVLLSIDHNYNKICDFFQPFLIKTQIPRVFLLAVKKAIQVRACVWWRVLSYYTVLLVLKSGQLIANQIWEFSYSYDKRLNLVKMVST